MSSLLYAVPPDVTPADDDIAEIDMSWRAEDDTIVQLLKAVVAPDESLLRGPVRVHLDPGGLRVQLAAYDARVVRDTIRNLGESGYSVLIPIPYVITRISDDTFEASFEEANIAITGVNEHDAYQALVAEILDTFDALSEADGLGQAAEQQLDVLRRHVVRR